MVRANHRQHKSRNAATAVTLSLCCGLFALGRRIEVKVKAKFREGLERYGEKKAIFFYSLIVTNYATERGDPARQIPVNGVALLFESFRGGFILLLDSDPPVIVDAIIWIVEVHIEKGVEFKPGDGLIVAASFQAIANANPPDCPIIDRVDRR